MLNINYNVLLIGAKSLRLKTKEGYMSKEFKHRRDEKKKPAMSLKERRAKKHEKKHLKIEHSIDERVVE